VSLSDSRYDKFSGMPILPNSINLIQTKTGSSSQINVVESSLRRSGFAGFVGFIGVAIVLTVIYILLYFQVQNLQQEKAF
jgi:hypothetical protein